MNDNNAREMLKLFLTTPDDQHASRLLRRLLHEHADPVIRAVVCRKMGVRLDQVQRLDQVALRGGNGVRPKRSQELDAEDVHASSLFQVAAELRDRRRSGQARPIEEFRAYAGSVALNAFADHLRRRHRRRHGLARKLLRVIRASGAEAPVSGSLSQASNVKAAAPVLGVWQGQGADGLLCGFRHWEGQPVRLTSRYLRWQTDPWEFGQEALPEGCLRQPDLLELVTHIMHWMGGPVPLNHLVGGLAELLELKEAEHVDPPEPPAQDAVPGDLAVRSLHYRELVQALWRELQALPLKQRWAFLLSREIDEVHLFVKYGCCRSVGQLAGLLQMSEQEFGTWYRLLPVPDDRIAAQLGLTRRQVINARLSALRRLRRRLSGWKEHSAAPAAPSRVRPPTADCGALRHAA